MKEMITALQRLYFLPGQQWHSQHPGADAKPAYAAEGLLTPALMATGLTGEKTIGLNLASADGMARAMVINFKKASDWELAANLYLAVQNDLDLPAPAVSVSGNKGYGLWFSLSESLPVTEAHAFLEALRLKYLPDLPADSLELCPASGMQSVMNLVPSLHMTTGKWSAYIDPSLGSMFMDEPWLEIAPNLGKQADILASLESIRTEDFQKACIALATAALPDAESPVMTHPDPVRAKLNINTPYTDPESFLLAVMNDPSASPRHRISAAKALLPYFRKNVGNPD
jgi:hypothetical protein